MSGETVVYYVVWQCSSVAVWRWWWGKAEVLGGVWLLLGLG